MIKNMDEPVVITGLGIVSSIGIGKKDFSLNLRNGKDGFSLIEDFDISSYQTKKAAKVKGFNPKEFISPVKLRRLDKASQFTIAASKMAIEDGKVTAGGGAAATAIAMALRDYAPSVGGREQMAIEAFANALEAIPRTLAENAGLDPIDIMIKIRKAHKQGKKFFGVNVTKGDIDDMIKNNVIEPLRVSTQEVQSASEAAIMILRIDDVIASKGMEKSEKPGGPGPQGGPGEMEY